MNHWLGSWWPTPRCQADSECACCCLSSQLLCHRQSHPVVLWAVVTGEPPVASSLVMWLLVLPVLLSGSLTLSLSCSSLLILAISLLLPIDSDVGYWLLLEIIYSTSNNWKQRSYERYSPLFIHHLICRTLCFDHFVLLQMYGCTHRTLQWMYLLINVLWGPIYPPGPWVAGFCGRGHLVCVKAVLSSVE